MPRRTSRRKLLSALFVVFCGLSVLAALVPLALIFFFVLSQGIRSLNLAFFTRLPAPVGETGGGMANSIVGTLILSGLGSIMALPIGIMSGVYMSEFAESRLSTAVRFAADTLNGVPSIVIGVFAYGVAVLPFRQYNAIAGGFALGPMMIPIIPPTTAALLPPGLARAGHDAGGRARARGDEGAGGVLRRAAGRAPRHHHRRDARARADCRRNGAAPLHRVQQPVLLDEAVAAHFVVDGPGVHLRRHAIRGLAPPGLGGSAGPGLDRARLLHSGPPRHPPARAHARPMREGNRRARRDR